jgi:hypothetical protein
MLRRTVIVACTLPIAFGSRSGRADHDHAWPATDGVAASVSLVAARFDTMLYGGDYQGVVPALRWTHDRYAVGAMTPLYRIVENGLETLGAGDVMVHGQLTIVQRERLATGATLGVAAPTGDRLRGLGMGHPMVMPAGWASYTAGRLALAGSLGVSAGFGGAAHHHDDTMWPLVDPMNRSELAWSASGDLAVAPAWRIGAQLTGGAPVVEAGVTRVIAGARAVWITHRVQTGFELQAGVAGDPFTLRGVAQTTLVF